MFVLRHFFLALAEVVNLALWIYMLFIIVRAFLSWVNPDPYNPIVRFLDAVTEPVLRPIRRRLPVWQMGVDLSPMIVILILIFLQRFLVPILHEIARMVA